MLSQSPKSMILVSADIPVLVIQRWAVMMYCSLLERSRLAHLRLGI